MYSRRTVLVSVLLLNIGIACAELSVRFLSRQPVQAGQDIKQVKWESYVLHSNDPEGDIQRRANSLGDEGWEISSVVIDPTTKVYVVFLKRPKR